MAQLKKRLKSVLDIHPDFQTSSAKIGTQKTPSLDDLISQAAQIEKELDPPFSVYIHGDFNLDNIIFDPENQTIKFIDLHRSCYQDYTQDISVFMVSNYRLQVLDNRTRNRIKTSALYLHSYAKEFARKNNDETFELRLALGLARSFITSTRFILDKGLANAMYQRAVYILQCIQSCPKKNIKKFKLPIEDLFT